MAEYAGQYDIDSLESTERQLSDLDLIKRLIQVYMLRHKLLVFIVGLIILVRMGVTLAGPFIYKVAIDFYIRKTPTASGRWLADLIESIAVAVTGSSLPSIWVFLAISAMMYILVGLASWIVTSLQEYYISKLGQNIIADIRSDFFRHLESLSQRFFEHGNTGRLVSRVTNDAEALKNIVSTGIIGLAADCILAGSIITVMVILDVQLTLITLMIAPVLGVVSRIFQGWIRMAWRVARIKIASLTAKVQELMYGVKVTKALTQEERSIREFDAVNEENMQAQIHAETISIAFDATVGVFSALVEALIWFVGGQQVIGAGPTLGDLVAFSQYAKSLLQPIQSIALFYGEIQSALAGAERIFSVLDIKPEVTEAPDAIDLTDVKGLIEFKDVSFSYVKGQPVLQDVSFKVHPGERLAIFGPTGAGKSSVVNLIGRFYDPDGGRVEIDGVDLRKVKLASLGQHIGIVLQEPYLFSGTIAYNLKFGRPQATDEEMIRVSKLVGIHDTIMKLERGYDTEIRERGTNLSYGQRQLICLARALVTEPTVLIIDEATSSVDPYTESLIQNALRKNIEARTVIIITHRVSTVRDADRIIVLDNGQIQDEGSHEELLERSDLYQRLCQMQLVSVAD